MIYLIIPNVVHNMVRIVEYKREQGEKNSDVLKRIHEHVSKNMIQDYIVVAGKILERHTW